MRPDAGSPSAPRVATAQAQPNIALVKYWGKRDAALNLPATGSLSITLESLHTRTEVRFEPALARDEFLLDGRERPELAGRVRACLDRLRALAGVGWRARVTSRNNFPTGAGLASSASGFAALVLAADKALGLGLSPGELAAQARHASGSAARSMLAGFVELPAGERSDGTDARPYQLLPPEAWPLEVVVALTSVAAKPTGSTEGMQRSAATSPFYPAWVAGAPADLAAARRAIAARDFAALADVAEANCLKMHALAMSARPGLLYWNGATVECLQRVRALRADGLEVFFTVDAGPQVKAICAPGAGAAVAAALRAVPGVGELLQSRLGPGARCLGESAASGGGPVAAARQRAPA